MKLCEQITQDGLWTRLEHIAIHTVTAGSIAAMGYYRDAWGRQKALSDQGKNPSTVADLEATSTIIQTCDSMISPVADSLFCGLSYFGEETVCRDHLKAHLSGDLMRRLHGTERFFAGTSNTIRIIFDGIDGTSNFSRGLPLFCTALAILIDEQVRVSAVYDPIHHEVCSAILSGSHECPEEQVSASRWQVASGNRLDLVRASKSDAPKLLDRSAVGVHLTRSNRVKLKDFVGAGNSPSGDSMLERLATATGGVYCLNSGIVAMREVAKGTLGGFVNITTYPWDIAAGEVLVRACGGKVTTFEGSPIRYLSPLPTSVVAAQGHLHSQILDVLSGANAPIE